MHIAVPHTVSIVDISHKTCRQPRRMICSRALHPFALHTEAAPLGDARLLQARVAAADERGGVTNDDPPGAPRALRAVQGCDGQSVRLFDAHYCRAQRHVWSAFAGACIVHCTGSAV